MMTLKKTEGYEILALSDDWQDVKLIDDNRDIEVRMANGSRYFLTIFALKNLDSLLRGYEASGECASGTYMWASNMVVMRHLTVNAVILTVEDLIESGEIKQVGAVSEAS